MPAAVKGADVELSGEAHCWEDWLGKVGKAIVFSSSSGTRSPEGE